MKKVLSIIAVVLFMASCNNVKLDKLYVEATSEKDLSALVKNKSITEEEKTMIVNYIVENEIVTENEITYSSILEAVRERKAREERNAKIQKELDEKMSVDLVKKYSYYWGEPLIAFDVKLTNKTDLNINGFIFRLLIKDGAGKELFNGAWIYGEDVVKANSTRIIERFTTKYNKSDDNQVKLLAANLDKLQVESHVESIIFDDGTSIELEEEE